MKKTLALLLALLLVLPMISVANAAEPAFKGELKYLMAYQGTDPNLEPPAKKLEELTGYKVTYYLLPSDGADEKLNLELSSGAEYDIVRLTINQFNNLVGKGAFLSLSPYMDAAPNFKGIMNDFEWSAGSYKGEIYGIPQFDAHYVGGGIGYNIQQWEQAGYVFDGNRQLSLTQFTDILRSVKDKVGVIPYVGNGAYPDAFTAPFGIVNHDWQPDVDGTIVPRFAHSNIKEYIETMHNLYTEGLIDLEWPVNKAENINQKFTSGAASAMWVGWAGSTALEASLADATKGNTVEYLFPLSDDNGFTRQRANAGVTGYGAVPVTCKQIDKVMDYLNTRSDFDIFEESFLGVEGEQWEFKDTNNDGVMEYWPLLGEGYGTPEKPGFTAWFNGHYFNLVNSPESFTTLWLCRARKGAVQYSCYSRENEYPKENWVDSPLAYAPPMASISKYSQALNAMASDYIIGCIAGTRTLDEYDAVYATWLADGGQEMIEEVNAYLESMK